MNNQEQDIKIHLSGKAVYKAVKNLLENDVEFRSKVMEQIAKEFADADKMESMISEHVKGLVRSNADIKKQIKEEVLAVAKAEIPNIIRERLNDTMKRSLIDMMSKLLGGK
jgi:hypothetical protein